MPEVKKVCLDCGKVETSRQCAHTVGTEKERKTVWGLCEDCYQRRLKEDPDLTRWAFKNGEEDEDSQQPDVGCRECPTLPRREVIDDGEAEARSGINRLEDRRRLRRP